MRVPMPCKFGDKTDCRGRLLPLVGVSWFKWSWGMDYTYFFSVDNFWHDTDMYTTDKKDQPYAFVIPDSLLEEKPIKEHGYPLRGRGYASGMNYKDGKTYMDFVITNNFYSHIRVQCNEWGSYIPNGDILFPRVWDDEKRQNAILKSFIPAIEEALSSNNFIFESSSIFDSLKD